MAAELRIGSETDGLWLKEFPSLDTGTLPALVYDSSTGEIKYRTVASSYALPPATDSIRGGVTIGTGINLVGDKISVTPYTLPAATSDSLGGIIPGTGLSMSGSTLNCTVTQVTPVDNILDWNGSSYAPFGSKQSGINIYTGTELPTDTTRLNINADLYSKYNRSEIYYFHNGSYITSSSSSNIHTSTSLYCVSDLVAGASSTISNQTKISAYSGSAIDTLISSQNTASSNGGFRIGVNASGNSVLKSGSGYFDWSYGSDDYTKLRWAFSSTATSVQTYTAVAGNGNDFTISASNYSGDVSGRRGGNISINAGTGYTQGGNISIFAGATASTGTAGSVYIYGGLNGYNPRVYLATNGTVDYGQVVIGNGAVGAPSLVFRASTTSGFYSPSTDTIALSMGGVEKFKFVNSTNGDFYAKGDVIACFGVSFPSDINLKKDISSLDSKDSLIKILELDPVKYLYKDGDSRLRYGLIAQQVQCVIPEIVSEKKMFDDNEYLTISYNDLIPLLINCIQELKNEIDLIKNK